MSARLFQDLRDGLRRLREILGGPGLMIGLFSILSFGFGLQVVSREYNRPRQAGRETIRRVLADWVRTPDYLGLTLPDYVDRWGATAPSSRSGPRRMIRDALDDLGAELTRRGDRFALVRVVGMEVAPVGGEALARWGSTAHPVTAAGMNGGDVVDRIPLIAAQPGRPAVDLLVRYRVAAPVEAAARDLETSYHRLLLALVGLSGYSLLCLGYMVLHARALSVRVAREAAQEAALDLADRTCHELGNGIFVLANERRNLANHLDLVDRFIVGEPEARAAAARRLGIDPALAARWDHALAREYASRGIDPALELRGSAVIARDVCRQIGVCVEYLSMTVRELDGFLKRSALPVEPTHLEIRTCFEESLALLGPRLESSGARVDLRLDDGRGPSARADRRLLVHALVNLLKNAVEAAAGAGIAPEIGLWARSERGLVLIGVADNGPGIPPGNLARVFEPGFSTKGPGRGRGLAIVRESIQVQGGTIRVAPRPAGGVEFVIELPAAEDELASNVN